MKLLCPVCNRDFERAQGLGIHMRYIHGVKSTKKGGESMGDAYKSKREKAIEFINKNLNRPLLFTQIAGAVGCSATNIHQLVAKARETGYKSYVEYDMGKAGRAVVFSAKLDVNKLVARKAQEAVVKKSKATDNADIKAIVEMMAGMEKMIEGLRRDVKKLSDMAIFTKEEAPAQM